MRSLLPWSLVIAILGAPAACGRFGFELLDTPGAGGAAAVVSSGGGGSPSDGAASRGASSGSGGVGGAASGSDGVGGDAAGSDGVGGAVAPSSDSGTAATDASVAAPALTGAIDIADPSQTVRSGVAAIVQNELHLTTDNQGATGAAFLPIPYPLTAATDFVVSFSFNITGSSPQKSDGFALLWQNDPRGSRALGAPGGNLGYDGITPPAITPSVIVELDDHLNVFDARGNQVAITTNGSSTTAIAEAAAPFPMDDGATHYVWIDYDAETTTLSVRAADTAQRPLAALVAATVNLYAIVGSSAFLGFTASCGNTSQVVAIESLTVD